MQRFVVHGARSLSLCGFCIFIELAGNWNCCSPIQKNLGGGEIKSGKECKKNRVNVNNVIFLWDRAIESKNSCKINVSWMLTAHRGGCTFSVYVPAPCEQVKIDSLSGIQRSFPDYAEGPCLEDCFYRLCPVGLVVHVVSLHEILQGGSD
jgi:hypothetical protein